MLLYIEVFSKFPVASFFFFFCLIVFSDCYLLRYPVAIPNKLNAMHTVKEQATYVSVQQKVSLTLLSLDAAVILLL